MEQDRGQESFLNGCFVGSRRGACQFCAYSEKAIRLGGDTPGVQISLGAAHARAGERGKALDILDRLEKGGEYVSPGELAILYAALGEREQALASLERAHAAHDLQLQYLKVDPAYDPLRSDPRFAGIMRKVGLPQ